MNEARTVYLEAAVAAVDLIGDERVAERWNEASVLPGMSVGVLAAHLARSVFQVEHYLDAGVDDAATPIEASTYFAQFEGATDRNSAMNVGVLTRGVETAERGADATAADSRQTLPRLEQRLLSEPTDRFVAVVNQPDQRIVLDEYLRTRLVEFAVHIDDLALSIGSSTVAPAAAIAGAVDVLVAAARERHGDLAVLHALSRRERDTADALHVL